MVVAAAAAAAAVVVVVVVVVCLTCDSTFWSLIIDVCTRYLIEDSCTKTFVN